LLAHVEAWLRDGKPSGVLLKDYDEGEPPKPNKNETIITAIERLRRRGRELRADLHRIASAPFPSAYCKQRMAAQIEALAMRGAPDVSMLIEHDGDIAWPTQRLQSQVIGTEQRTLAFTELAEPIAVLAWLLTDQLKKRLSAEIDTEADDGAALTHEMRQQREAETMSDLLAVERDEAALVWQAQAQNLPCEHRAEILPPALLGLQLITAPRAAPPPTSPEHGYNIVGGRR
jgi:hypothetical protein